MARRTSSRVISRFLPATATTPRLLNPLMCGPESARWTVSISMPAVSSASSIAFLIDSTAASRLTTAPRRMPCDSATPRPMISRPPLVEHLADDGRHLRRAEIEPDQVPLFSCHDVLRLRFRAPIARFGTVAARRRLRPGNRRRRGRAVLPRRAGRPDVARARRSAGPRSRCPAPAPAAPAPGPRYDCSRSTNWSSPSRTSAGSPSRTTTASCGSGTSICETRRRERRAASATRGQQPRGQRGPRAVERRRPRPPRRPPARR